MKAEPLVGRLLDSKGDRYLVQDADGTLVVVRGEKRVKLTGTLRSDVRAALAGFGGKMVTGILNAADVWGIDPAGPVSCFLPVGERITAITCDRVAAVGTARGAVHLISLEDASRLAEIEPPSGSPVAALRFCGTTLLITDEQGSVFRTLLE